MKHVMFRMAGGKQLLLAFALLVISGATLAGAATSPLLHNSERFPSSTKWSTTDAEHSVPGWGIVNAKYGEFTCKTCHGKNTGNIKRVLKNVAVLDPAFVGIDAFPIEADAGQQVIFLDPREGDSDFGNDSVAGRVDPAKSDKICEACHSQTKYHNYDTANNTPSPDPNHYNGADCISCHRHNVGFMASCDACHNASSLLADSHGVHYNTSTVATGNFVSNDSTVTNYIFQCGNCHDPASTNHAAGDVIDDVQAAQVVFNSALGTYTSPGTAAAASPDSGNGRTFAFTAGSCDTNVCHNDGTVLKGAPNVSGAGGLVWSETSLPTDCTGCHNNDKDSALPMVSNAHPAHINNGAIMTDKSCQTCHDATLDVSNTTIADKTKHINDNRDVSIIPLYNGGNSWDGTSCDAVYCHSDGKATPGYKSIDWTTSIGDCTSCHDGAVANTTLSSAHQAHIFNSADFGRDLDCGECHASTVTVGNNMLITGPSEHVDKIRTLNVANFGTARTDCSNVDCHSDGNYDSVDDSGQGQQFNNPDWATGSYDCDDCHGQNGVVPYPVYNTALGAPTGDRNSHYTHVNNGNMACAECHYDTSKTGTALDGNDPSVHVNRTVDVVFNATGLSSGALWTNADNSCATTYCHGGSTPEWGGSVACGSCHEVNKNLPPSHATHYNSLTQGDKAVADINSTATEYVFECGSCHDSVPHADGNPDVQFNTVVGGSIDAGKTCSATYCHSDGTTTVGPFTGGSPTWNSSVMACNSCHADEPATFKHTAHVDNSKYNFNCTECHRATTLDGSSIANKINHVNRAKDVVYNSLNSGSTYVNAESDCTNLYCHSDGKGGAPKVTGIQWNSATTLDCAGCHDVASATTTLSSAHKSHIYNSAEFGRDLSCFECHDDTVETDNVTLDPSTGYDFHVDGYNTIKVRNYGTAKTDCSSVQCHSDGNYDGTLTPQNGSLTWTNDTKLSCTDCHDPVNAANGLADSGDTNSHSKHVTDSGLGCQECHEYTSQDGTSLNGTDATKHVNNIVDVMVLQNTAAFSYDASSNLSVNETCSNTYCHGTAPSPSWGGTTSCESCHSGSGDPSGTALNKTLPGSHGAHFNTSVLAVNGDWTPENKSDANDHLFTCGVCHDKGQGVSHSAGKVGPNQFAEIGFNAAIAGTGATYVNGALLSNDNGFNYTGGTCSVYCHSSGEDTPVYNTITWGGSLDANCAGCHQNASGLVSGAHKTHVNDGTIMTDKSCETCHTVTTTDGSSINDKTVHVNKSKDVNVAVTYNSGGNFTFTQGADSCDSVYCHSDGKATLAFDAVAWNENSTGCNFCHGDSGGGVGGAGTALYNSHKVHTGNDSGNNLFQLGCQTCHSVTATDSSNINDINTHINQQVDVDINDLYNTIANTYNATNADCSATFCHGSTSPAWTDDVTTTTGDCSACHGMAADPTDGRDTAGHTATGNTANDDPQVGVHVAHLNASSGISAAITCDECHVDPKNTGGSYFNQVGTANHMNGITEVPLSGSLATNSATISPSYTTGAGTCATTYCHDGAEIGNGWDGADDKTPVWYNSLYLDHDNNGFLAAEDCNNCHGYPPAGSHVANSDCKICHFNVLNLPDGSSVANASIFNVASLHIDGIVQAEGGNNCTDCHNGDIDAGLNGVHASHTNSAVLLAGKTVSGGGYGDASWWFSTTYENGQPKFGCGQCHPDAEGTGHPANGLNLDLDPTNVNIPVGNVKLLNATQSITRTERVSVTCASVYCHSDASVPTYKTTLDWYDGTGQLSGNCNECHDNGPSSGTHSNHLVGIHYKTLYDGASNLMAATGNVGSGAAHGDPNTADTIGCQSCHNATVKVEVNDQNSVCVTCHNSAPTFKGNMVIDTAGSSHVNGTPDVVFDTFSSFKSKAQVRDDITTVAELNTNWGRNGGYKTANSFDQAKVATPNYNSTAGVESCSNVSCHNGIATPAWGDGFGGNCRACHTTLP